jgi:hypothetical protein
MRFLNIILLLLLNTAALAQEYNGFRISVIVANNEGDQELKNLRYADDDGVLWAELLEMHSQKTYLLTLLDDQSQRRFPKLAQSVKLPTKINLQTTLQEAYAQLSKAQESGLKTELIFIFVGHGGLDSEGKGYLLLHQDRFSRSDLFHEIIAASPAERTHVVLDACHAQALVAGRGNDQNTDRSFESFLKGHDLDAYPRVGVLWASSDKQKTHEWSRIESGVFSHLMRSALSGAADLNLDSKLEYSEVAAFVEAGFSDLKREGKFFETHVWPPRADRHSPMITLGYRQALRKVTLAADLAGHLQLEDERGVRLVELHKAGGLPSQLYLASLGRIFLKKDGREHEIAAKQKEIYIDQPPQKPTNVNLADRGAMDMAFERGLFRVPFNVDYYKGYLSGKSHLLSIELKDSFLPAGLPQDSWELGFGYQAQDSIVFNELAHGFSLFAKLKLWPGWYAGLVSGLTLSQVVNPVIDAWSFSLMPCLEYRYPLTSKLGVFATAGLGWGILVIDGPTRTQDNSVWSARFDGGLFFELTNQWFIILRTGYLGQLYTVDAGQKWHHGLSLGLDASYRF